MKHATKKRVMTLFVVLIFFGSTIAFAVIGALGLTTQQPQQPTTIPNERTFNTSDTLLENFFVQNGYTVAVLNYNGTCCEEILNYLEGMSSDNRGQIAVFKNDNSGINQKSLKITSLFKTTVLVNEEVTTENIFDNLCEIMISTPLECGLKKVTPINKTENTSSI